MKKSSSIVADELRAEYVTADFPQGFARGKYAARIAEGSNIVVLDPDLAAAFPSSQDVNAALRSLIRVAKKVVVKPMRAGRRSAAQSTKST